VTDKKDRSIFDRIPRPNKNLLAPVKSRFKQTKIGSKILSASKSAIDSQDAMQGLVLAPYRLLGQHTEKLLPRLGELEKQMLRANIKIAFPAYVAFMLLFSAVGGATIFISSFLIAFVLGATVVTSFLLAFVLGVSCLLIVLGLLYVYPSMQAGTRKRLLEEELPYVASHMSVLSRSGLPPERILRSLSDVEAVGIRSVAAEEAANIDRDVHYLGLDVISAIERRMRTSPSRRFVDYLDGFVSVARTGGDLTSYFLSAARGFMDQARIAARQLVETLGGLAEAYVSMMVVFPLLMIVMLSIMNMIGGGIGGFSTIFLMQLITYVGIPMMALIMLLLLDSVMPPR
jgi:flagellar protein FlaJ